MAAITNKQTLLSLLDTLVRTFMKQDGKFFTNSQERQLQRGEKVTGQTMLDRYIYFALPFLPFFADWLLESKSVVAESLLLSLEDFRVEDYNKDSEKSESLHTNLYDAYLTFLEECSSKKELLVRKNVQMEIWNTKIAEDQQLQELATPNKKANLEKLAVTSHHIFPFALGGTNAFENLVTCVRGEHALIHLFRYMKSRNRFYFSGGFAGQTLPLEQLLRNVSNRVSAAGLFANVNRGRSAGSIQRTVEAISGSEGSSSAEEFSPGGSSDLDLTLQDQINEALARREESRARAAERVAAMGKASIGRSVFLRSNPLTVFFSSLGLIWFVFVGSRKTLDDKPVIIWQTVGTSVRSGDEIVNVKFGKHRKQLNDNIVKYNALPQAQKIKNLPVLAIVPENTRILNGLYSRETGAMGSYRVAKTVRVYGEKRYVFEVPLVTRWVGMTFIFVKKLFAQGDVKVYKTAQDVSLALPLRAHLQQEGCPVSFYQYIYMFVVNTVSIFQESGKSFDYAVVLSRIENGNLSYDPTDL